MHDELFSPLFAPDALVEATGDDAWVAALVRFEVELAAAEADVGVVPASAAAAIANGAARLSVAAGDLGREGRGAGNPVVPLVARLGATSPDAAGFVHFGATSQDALDTAAMLVARNACRLTLDALTAAATRARTLAEENTAVLLAGRTLLQQALPITFALKAAGWAVALEETRAALARVVENRLAVQLGGATGTLAALGDAGPAVVAALARRLGLGEPVLSWHTDRSRIAELAGALAAVAGAAGKVALDIVLLAQSEVDEVSEAAGGSSTLPHKQNPVHAVRARAAAARAPGLASVLFSAMAQEHERGAGAWHAEWETLRDLLRAAGGAAANVAAALAELQVHPEQMQANLDRLRGVLLAERVMLDLAPELGRERAHHLVAAAARDALASGTTLRVALDAVAAVTARRTPAELDALCDPRNYLGASASLVSRVLSGEPAPAPTRRENGGD